MKNILKLSFVALLAISAVSCKKEYSQVSKVVTPSYPTINFPNGKFFSIKVGQTAPQIVANAYDSLLKQAMGVTYETWLYSFLQLTAEIARSATKLNFNIFFMMLLFINEFKIIYP
ncbi:MAG: hypothetical protein ACKOXV_04855, partial [Bacteroidota bacterium]